MDYDSYIPKFIKQQQPTVAFPPLLPERWSRYPSAQAILRGVDAGFYSDPSVNPNAKSREFRKAVAADWANDNLRYNPHFFTVFPYGTRRDNNIANSTFSQTAYLKSMMGDDWLDENADKAEAEDFERADDEINPPAHQNTNLIQNLIIPYIAGEPLNPVNTPAFRQRFIKDRTTYPEKDSAYYLSRTLGNGAYADLVDERLRQRQAMTSPRYTYEPLESLNWGRSTDILPTDRQLEQIRSYRSEIDRRSGVDPEDPWNYELQ